MDVVENGLQFMNNYGWAGICLLLVIVIAVGTFMYVKQMLMKQSNSIEDKMLEMTSNIAKEMQHTQAESYRLMTETFQTFMKQQQMTQNTVHIESANHRQEIMDDIGRKLWDMMHFYNAQRTYICEFHNGGSNLDGLSFLKYDVTHEKTAKSVRPIMDTHQNLPMSTLKPVINDVIDANATTGIVIYDEEAIEGLYDRGANNLYYDLYNARKCNHLAVGGVFNKENHLYGLVFVEWDLDNPFPEQIMKEGVFANDIAEITGIYGYAKKFD
jgi:hypothetical protein